MERRPGETRLTRHTARRPAASAARFSSSNEPAPGRKNAPARSKPGGPELHIRPNATLFGRTTGPFPSPPAKRPEKTTESAGSRAAMCDAPTWRRWTPHKGGPSTKPLESNIWPGAPRMEAFQPPAWQLNCRRRRRAGENLDLLKSRRSGIEYGSFYEER
jgi:hypothetical protein